jgi:hypothetical protein
MPSRLRARLVPELLDRLEGIIQRIARAGGLSRCRRWRKPKAANAERGDDQASQTAHIISNVGTKL